MRHGAAVEKPTEGYMSQLDTLCEKLGISIVSKFVDTRREGEHGWMHHIYRVTLSRRIAGKRRTLTTTFRQGTAHTSDPTAADVLYCLASDARSGEHETYESFASDFGYDVDSRKGEAIYKACKRTAPKVRRFLGKDFDAVANAEH